MSRLYKMDVRVRMINVSEYQFITQIVDHTVDGYIELTINRANFDSMPEATKNSILKHEMLHVARMMSPKLI